MSAVLLSLAVLALPNLSWGEGSDSPTLDELARMELSLSGEEICTLYREPVDSMNFPRKPFFIHPKKFYARVQGAQDYDSWMNRYLLSSGPAREKSTLLEQWLRTTAAALHLSPASQIKLHTIDQQKFCADEAEAKLGDLLEKQKENEPKKAILAAMAEIKNRCLNKNIGAASFILSKIYFGSSLLEKPIEEKTQKLALLHELCHLVYPGIAGQAQEEIFCDAMAWRWSQKIWGEDSRKIREEYAHLLYENNPNEDLLLLRGKLVEECKPLAKGATRP